MICVLYVSKHHKNTEKLLKSLNGCDGIEVDLFDFNKGEIPDFNKYEYIGFGSGIYAGKFDKNLRSYIDKNFDASGKKVFLVSTSGIGKTDHNNSLEKTLSEKGASVIGSFNCKGFDTFGPLKIIGGKGKGRPNEEDMKNFRKYILSIIK